MAQQIWFRQELSFYEWRTWPERLGDLPKEHSQWWAITSNQISPFIALSEYCIEMIQM